MSKEKRSDNVFNNPVLGTCIGVDRETGGAMITQDFAAGSPLPCIVILVHGVNDIGEAYETQEQGIVAGLNTRLARTDMHPNEWAEMCGLTDLSGAARRITASDRSPVIPFYWGYRPVDRETYDADQQRYRDEVKKLGLESVLPYDAFQENDPKRLKKLNPEMRGFCNDNYGNVLNLAAAKNGGTFANATTCIPDMLGPGANGGAIWMAGVYSRKFNGGDFTHPIYGNPHRIYQFFAAQRLADLILEIRKNKATELDTINIVAHSQGTLITMLANMILKQKAPQYTVADCTILCHSPYSLEPRFLENLLPGRQQTAKARQETMRNFCRLMATNPKYDPSGRYHPDFVQAMLNDGTLARKHQWHSDPRYSRNNYGRVYNYFCPDDGIVSLQNVQGVGWRGIPDQVATGMENLYQRAFCQHYTTGGNPTHRPFEKPAWREGDFRYDGRATNAAYPYHSGVTLNAEALPQVFELTLMGSSHDGEMKFKTGVAGEDRYIDYSARAHEGVWQVKEKRPLIPLHDYGIQPGHILTEAELSAVNVHYKTQFTGGRIIGSQQRMEYLLLRNKTDQEIDEMAKYGDPVKLSQHSAIVMDPNVQEKAVAYDLAIGNCMAFEDPEFWLRLRKLADWRHMYNPDEDTRSYYSSGQLNFYKTKKFMNKPDEVLPAGEFGVVNEYYPGSKISPARHPEFHHKEVPLPQWDMPDPLNYLELPSMGHKMVF
ncbi:DUF3274 domain-containing protein [Pantoea sp. At-9b]|uniref:T6SS effector phospholipase Tle3 domain-containing protein n=1 Tax=Pantoea sp. (strain At-9b) TaxID=592316 RepID=UPI0001B3F456|nr:DUF3274 domain-containing protein [Pantoea sp. At-9b]ADU71310.1 conserved hypothetical protein [Pantoea sp. At-9b]